MQMSIHSMDGAWVVWRACADRVITFASELSDGSPYYYFVSDPLPVDTQWTTTARR